MILSENQDKDAMEILPEEYISKLPLFRLKRLSFNQEFKKLPLHIDRESLERLDIREAMSTLGLKGIFMSKNLKHLNIQRGLPLVNKSKTERIFVHFVKYNDKFRSDNSH